MLVGGEDESNFCFANVSCVIHMERATFLLLTFFFLYCIVIRWAEARKYLDTLTIVIFLLMGTFDEQKNTSLCRLVFFCVEEFFFQRKLGGQDFFFNLKKGRRLFIFHKK